MIAPFYWGLFSVIVGFLDMMIGLGGENILVFMLGFFVLVGGLFQISFWFFSTHKVMIIRKPDVIKDLNSSHGTKQSIDKCRCQHSLLDKCGDSCLCEIHNEAIVKGRAIAWHEKDNIRLV